MLKSEGNVHRRISLHSDNSERSAVVCFFMRSGLYEKIKRKALRLVAKYQLPLSIVLTLLILALPGEGLCINKSVHILMGFCGSTGVYPD